jgi:RNA polymerase sigma factor (TIGR02999 family)
LETRGDVTRLLADLCAGREKAREELIPLLYEELRSLAGYYMRRQKPGHTLQTTALVHEAYLKLVGDRGENWESRAHFMKVAARAMRSVLVDHERRRKACKRGGGREREPLVEASALTENPSHTVLDLDEALDRLSGIDPLTGQVVELRFFGGVSVEEAARALGISESTVKREWRVAKAWLKNEMTRDME